MIKFLKSLLCRHEWVEQCLCGPDYVEFCPSKKKYNDCKTHYIGENNSYCSYYYKSCKKCGKELRGTWSL